MTPAAACSTAFPMSLAARCSFAWINRRVHGLPSDPWGAAFTDCNALAYSGVDGQLYTISATTGSLVRIDPQTGRGTDLGRHRRVVRVRVRHGGPGVRSAVRCA